MSIRMRLVLLAAAVGVCVLGVIALFYSSMDYLDVIEKEQSSLTVLADSVRDLSVAVNSLDSNQYKSVTAKLEKATAKSEEAFALVASVKVLPSISDDLKKAFEVIGNMHGLISPDLKTLTDQNAALKADLERYFFESSSTTLRMFYTNDGARAKKDVKEVYKRIDDLVTSINGLTETLSGVTDTIQDQVGVIQTETAKVRQQSIAAAIGLSGLMVLAIILVAVFLGNLISKRVKDMQAALVPVSQGDFSKDIPVRGRDEIASMVRSVNELLGSLNRLLGQVRSQVVALDDLGVSLTSKMGESSLAVEDIQSHVENTQVQLVSQTRGVTSALNAARTLGGLTDNLNGAFQTQMEILASSSSGIEEIIANIGSVHGNAAKADDSTQILQEISRDGQAKLDLVVASVQEIAQSSQNLVEVTAIINDVANQTNLLAMNASIEAAHAGDAGRGFGVVAEEIRKLAEQTGSQSKEISKDLQIVNESIKAIQAATVEAVQVFQKVVTQTGPVRTIVREVQNAMDEQNKGGTLILEGIHQLNEIAAQVGRAVGEMKQGESQILRAIQDLADQNTQVNQNNAAVESKTREIRLIIEKTNEIAGSTRLQISTLEEETSRFRIKD